MLMTKDPRADGLQKQRVNKTDTGRHTDVCDFCGSRALQYANANCCCQLGCVRVKREPESTGAGTNCSLSLSLSLSPSLSQPASQPLHQHHPHQEQKRQLSTSLRRASLSVVTEIGTKK